MDTRSKILPRGGQATQLRQKNNEWSNKYFAIAIGAMMVIGIAYHWINVLYFQKGREKNNPFISKVVTCQRLGWLYNTEFHFLLSRHTN